MPRIQKQRIGKKTDEKQIVIDTFLLYKQGGENTLTAIAARNCDCADGSLSAGLGFAPYQTDDGVNVESALAMKSFHVARIKDAENGNKARKELYAVDSTGYLHKYYDTVGKFLELNSNFSVNKILTVWTQGVGTYLFFVAPQKICVQKDGEGAMSQLCAENRGLACICKNRIFYVHKNCDVAYSDPLAPLDWTESLEGYGVLYANEKDGLVQGLVALGDSVIVLYENGLKKIKVAGSTRDFELEKIEYNGGRVYFNTAYACGNAVFFLAADGIYRYDGNTVQRACAHLPIAPVEDDEKCLSACHKGEYLLSYTDSKLGEYTVAIKEDGKDGYFSDAVTGLSGDMNCAIAQNGTTVGVYARGAKCPKGLYDYITDFNDLGKKRNKTIKKITLYGEGELFLTLTGNGWVQRKKLTFEQGVAEWQIMAKSEKFAFRFQLNQGVKVTKMVMDVVYC